MEVDFRLVDEILVAVYSLWFLMLSPCMVFNYPTHRVIGNDYRLRRARQDKTTTVEEVLRRSLAVQTYANTADDDGARYILDSSSKIYKCTCSVSCVTDGLLIGLG